MKEYAVCLDDSAIDGLVEIFVSLWEFLGSEESARAYIDQLEAFCFKLDLSPYRGTKRDDLYPGLYVTHYRSNIRIGYFVNDEKAEVRVILIEAVKKNLSPEIMLEKLS